MFKKIIAFLVSMFLTFSFTLRRASTGENNPNNEMTIKQNRFAAENTFISQKRERNKLPTYAKEKDNLPISVLFEYVFGVKPDAQHNVIRWNIDLTDRFGIEQYPFGTDATLSLLCEARGSTAEEPQVHIESDRPVTVEIYWDGGRQSKTVTLTGN